ncbi:MAG TPA: hypothetical protein VIX11_10500, partial [Candidatus Acidoferrum sp.]
IPIQSLHVAQPVWANFKTRQVSLDGKTVCCTIASGPTAAAAPQKSPSPSAAPAAPQPAPNAATSAKPSPPALSVSTAIAERGAIPTAKIQALSVTSKPIPGGQEGAGNVTLTADSPKTPVIVELSSDKPGVVSIPATISVSNQFATFAIATSGIAQATEVNIKANARGGNEVLTAKLTVRPSQLSAFDCAPDKLPSGTPVPCKVSLDGKAPMTLERAGGGVQSQGIQLQLTADKPLLVSSQSVVVGAGMDRAAFQVPTIADAQGGSITLTVSYQNVSKSATVQLTPAMIKDFGCYVGGANLTAPGARTCTITPWQGPSPYTDHGLLIHLSSPQAQDTKIGVSEPGRLHHTSAPFGWGPIDISPGQTAGQLSGYQALYGYFEPVPRTENHTVSVHDPVSGTTLQTTFVVLPARILNIGFGDAADAAQNPATVNSLVGQKVKVWVSFDSPPAPTDWQSENAWLDVSYGGSVDSSKGSVAVQGPNNPAIREQDCSNQGAGPFQNPTRFCVWNATGYRPDLNNFSFEVILGACSKAEHPNGCQATVTVSSNQALGSQLGVLNVIPQ